jgi:hypothetical protein
MNGVTWLQRGRGSKEKYIVIEKQSVQSTLLLLHYCTTQLSKFRWTNRRIQRSTADYVTCRSVSLVRKQTRVSQEYRLCGRSAWSSTRNEFARHVNVFDASRYTSVSSDYSTQTRIYKYNYGYHCRVISVGTYNRDWGTRWGSWFADPSGIAV